ncbi:MAG TPA: hypothetical protein VNB24_02625 [Acidimicrobiales bacterium]|nr:hypothetical protein [Acidimicrobiales bacterium]
MAESDAETAKSWTDQDEARDVEGRLMPPTVPDRNAIREDRAALDQEHKADRMPTPEEEQAADAAGPVDPAVAENYKEAMERGANQEGEGRITP